MPDPSQRSLLSDVELVEYANLISGQKNRSLREVKDDTLRDAKVIEDRASGERITVPNKFIRSIGVNPAFELMRPDLFQEYTQQK
tara:strand:+ start:2829 stop:3083 length:255 start_codon:yes stop_codon:yes gene_type:complete